MALTVPFNEPFFLGGATAADTPWYAPVAIGARQYFIDLKKYQRQTISSIRPPSDTSSEPGEQSLTQEGLWRRSQSSFHLGSGQDYFDDEDSLRQRFNASKGIDPWTKRQLTLLKSTEQKRASVATNLKVLQVGTRLYIVDGQQLYFTNDPTVASPTFTSSVIHAGEGPSNVQGIATDGATVWAALGSEGIHQTVAGATSSTALATGTFEGVGYANGRLLAWNNNVLYEVSRAGVSTAIRTHPNPDFQWNGVTSAPNAIYAFGTCVDRSEIYAFSAINANGSLDPPTYAGNTPEGETLNALAYYGGAIIFGTSRGLRLGVVGSNNSLNHGPVVRIADVLCVEPQGEFVWFGWTNFDSVSTGLGRADLSHFTGELVPAYASDLMATGQGSIQSVATVGTRRYFAVSGLGFYGETLNYVPSGTLDTGFIRYGTVEKKIATALDFRHDPLPAGASISVSVETEEGGIQALGSSTLAASLSPQSPLGIEIDRTEAIKVHLTITRGTTPTEVPVLRRWTLYSRVSPVLNDVIILPIIMKDRVLSQLGEGQEIAYDTLEHYQFFQNLADTKQIQRYQEGSSSYNVNVTAVKVEPHDWNANRSFFNGLIYVTLVTINVI